MKSQEGQTQHPEAVGKGTDGRVELAPPEEEVEKGDSDEEDEEEDIYGRRRRNA